ncbi:thiamine-phosphate kinase [Microbacterium sp.]|uniref:thiamine-phosphate kinase n=1 Tax=Microbacterium sp. TaxID=51671 RepID=UPI0039E6D594
MDMPDGTTVGEAGERAVLARVFAALGGSSRAEVGPGDDAAVLAAPGGRVVVSTDTLVHGPDFRLAWSSGFDLGFKAAAVNLADIAAMGARPTALFVALALPDDTAIAFVEDLAAGLRAACEDLAPGCAVEGGDLTASDTLTLAVTAVGVLDGAAVLRSGARAGDIVAVAGQLGAAARGLAVLFDRFRDAQGHPVAVDAGILSDTERADLAAQLRPRPPIALGPVAAVSGATALMDVSDGLLLDATRMADASGVTIDLRPGLDDDALRGGDCALRGGEDHALLACFPPAAALPEGFREIGRVVPRGLHGGASVTIAGAPATGQLGWDPHRDWDAGRG